MLYNALDERIRVVTTPAVGVADTRVYIYDLDHRIVGEYGAGVSADVKAEYIWLLPEVGASGPTGGDDGTGGYMPLAIAKGTTGALNWVHSHHNAKPIMLTDSTGATVAYSGHAVLGFPGQFANAVGLAGAQYYYNYYRDYDDTTGRYIQADPIGLAGDANPYAYARGNALRYTDPTGEVVWFAAAACFGGGCQGAGVAATAATGALIGGAIAWAATHPILPPKNSAPNRVPLPKTNCPDDDDDECAAQWEEDRATCRRAWQFFSNRAVQVCFNSAFARYSECSAGRTPSTPLHLPPRSRGRWNY